MRQAEREQAQARTEIVYKTYDASRHSNSRLPTWTPQRRHVGTTGLILASRTISTP